MNRTFWKQLAGAMIAAAALALAGCGGGGGGGGPEVVGIAGDLVGSTAPRAAARTAAQVPFTAPVAAVIVDQAGARVVQATITPPATRFTLANVPTGRDYVIVFRDGSATGRTLGVLVADDASGRTVFAVPAGSGNIELGALEIDLRTGRAKARSGLALAAPGAGSPLLADRDRDGIPDLADLSDDEDGDGIPDEFEVANGLNPWDDRDAADDRDGDGLSNLVEFQRGTDPLRTDTDDDGLADADDDDPRAPRDSDGDGIADIRDNCPAVANADQANFDADGRGDACDPDDDNDGVADAADAFPFDPTRFA
ncbi:MAG: thrombospondin type 3 repeat-containing protein, partial [Deferrisomatales bacterium]